MHLNAKKLEYHSHMKVLVIEDDRETANYIYNGLKQQGHVVDLAANGRDGLILASKEPYDVMLVDRMLPGLDGLSIVRTIRGAGVQTPVLFLTTMASVENRVEGLEAGGDDYLVKPFAFSELTARINALARRPAIATETTVYRVGDLEMNLVAREVFRAGTALNLRPLEFRLLEYFMRRPGRVVTRTMLLEQVWGFHFDPKTKVVDTNISRLRGKIDKPFDFEMLQTVRGVGYLLKAVPDP